MLAVALPMAWAATAPVAAQDAAVEVAARELTEAWSHGRAAVLAERMGPSGVRVALLDRDYGALDRRNAAAALEVFLDRYRVQGATLARAAEVGGTPDRGFAEIRFDVVAKGTSEVLHFTVFAGFARIDDGWWVVELRVLP